MPIAFCPDCETRINLGKEIKKGDVFNCPECDVELMVVSLSPLIVDYAEVEEDWYDEDYEDYIEGDDEYDEELI
ncbi:MAG: lysine biosynthesis protein LysW [Anaerolineae bacterium]